jgi:hypothetical protein
VTRASQELRCRVCGRTPATARCPVSRVAVAYICQDCLQGALAPLANDPAISLPEAPREGLANPHKQRANRGRFRNAPGARPGRNGGRPRRHETNADRQRSYRKRAKEKAARAADSQAAFAGA